MIKENLKIKVNPCTRDEALDLLRSLGKELYSGVYNRIREVGFLYIYAQKYMDWDGFDSQTNFVLDGAKEITIVELRELARPKEYLNTEYELVVTNQPKDGWILVPGGAECFLYFYNLLKHLILKTIKYSH